jgi:hypothetical protein
MKKILFIFCFFLSAIVLSAQNFTQTYFGVISLQDDSVLEGNVWLDFEQHLIIIKKSNVTSQTIILQTPHQETVEERKLSFSAVKSVSIFDNQINMRREFIGLKHNELYEVVLVGELALLRYYHKNTPSNPNSNTPTQTEISYFLYEQTHQKVVAIQNLNNQMGEVFHENLGIVRKLIQSKNYQLDNLHHIATLVRYHNQCRMKALANR